MYYYFISFSTGEWRDRQGFDTELSEYLIQEAMCCSSKAGQFFARQPLQSVYECMSEWLNVTRVIQHFEWSAEIIIVYSPFT